MVFRCSTLICISPSFADVDCEEDSYNGVCVSAAAPGLRNYGSNMVLGLDDRGIAVVSLPSGQWIRRWPSAYHQVVQVLGLYELDMVVALERELCTHQLYLMVYRSDGAQLFTLPLATCTAVMGACPVRSWIAVATSSVINVWLIEKGGGTLDHIFEINLSKSLFGGLALNQITIHGNFIAFSTTMEIFVLHIVMCGEERANRKSQDNNRGGITSRGRGVRSSSPFSNNTPYSSDRRSEEVYGLETVAATDEDDVLLCLFEAAGDEDVDTGWGHMPTFDDDSAVLTSPNEIDSAVWNADHFISLQPINLRKNLTYHSYPSPDKCQIVLARRCNPGTKITGIEMLELGQQQCNAGSELQHVDGTAASCCISLVVSTSQGATLYHLHSMECDGRNLIVSSENHRMSQAEIKYRTQFTCKSSLAKSSQHFLFALTEDRLETWTLSLPCDCHGDVPVPSLLHVQDLTAAGCTPRPTAWLMVILDIGLILIPSFLNSLCDERGLSSACDDHRSSPGRSTSTSVTAAAMTADVIDNAWLTGRCCLKHRSSPALKVESSLVAALLELLPVVDIYAQIQKAVRQWLGDKDNVSLEPERGERYRACVMPFYHILRAERHCRGLSFWCAAAAFNDDERVLMQAYSSSHDVLATDCASLVAELCLASWGLDNNSDGMLERLWEACKWFQRASIPTVEAMSCLTKWIESVVASLAGQNQEWVSRCGHDLERVLFEQYFIVALLQSGGGTTRPPIFIDESDEAMEEFDRLMFRAIAYMDSRKSQAVESGGLLVHFIVSAKNIPWKQLPRSRLEAYNCLSALSPVSRRDGWVSPERQVALAVLEMYLDEPSPCICEAKDIPHSHADSLVEACIVHPDLVLACRPDDNSVMAGPLAVALMADNQSNILTRALVGLCRPPQEPKHHHPSELVGGVSERTFDPLQLLCALGPAGVAAANRITIQSRELPTYVSASVVDFLGTLCNMGWNDNIGLKAELMRSYLAQIESPSGPPPSCKFLNPPPEWMWHLLALLTDIDRENDSSSSSSVVCDEGGVKWTSGFMDAVFRMAGPSPSAVPPSELLPELHSVRPGEKWSAMDATIFVLQLSSEPVKKSVPRLLDVLRSCHRLDDGRSILSGFIDYACGDEPDCWRATLAIVRVEAQAEEDSEQRQLLATVAMEIMTSCSDRFRGSLKDFISALPDAAPLAACVCTLQKLGRGN